LHFVGPFRNVSHTWKSESLMKKIRCVLQEGQNCEHWSKTCIFKIRRHDPKALNHRQTETVFYTWKGNNSEFLSRRQAEEFSLLYEPTFSDIQGQCCKRSRLLFPLEYLINVSPHDTWLIFYFFFFWVFTWCYSITKYR